MKKQILKINRKFYELLKKEDEKKILIAYGYNSPEKFFYGAIEKINKEYDFLDIEKFDFLNIDESKEYSTYNGYISGDFLNYDFITVSFTNIIGKGGNVFLTQQTMPMITKKWNSDQNFLLDNRIKKILLLTTHKSKKFSSKENIIKVDKTHSMQVAVKYINTIGFDVIDMFHIKNLDINSRYNSIHEIIDHTSFLKQQKKSNSQFNQIQEKEGTYFADFEKTPKGQEIKFFALKIYAAAILLKGEYVLDISKAMSKSSDKTLKSLNGFIQKIKKVDTSRHDIFKNLSEEIEKESEIDIIKDNIEKIKRNQEGICYKRDPIYEPNKKGKYVYKTQRRFKVESFEKHNYKCACENEKHQYFTSECTKKRYVEGHHMIPMEHQDIYWKDKKRNLDCTINLIPLCGHCHGKIHKSIKKERIEIITEVYLNYKKQLLMIDNDLTLYKFAELYNVYIY